MPGNILSVLSALTMLTMAATDNILPVVPF